MKPASSSRGVVLLWALWSQCNLRCQYCYFGTLIKSKKHGEPLSPGVLSHSAKNDAPLETILSFIDTFAPNVVRRVFIAGGEPLIRSDTYRVVSSLLRVGCEVIINTNGLPLRSEVISAWLANSDIKAVAISLDSYDAKYNDKLRIDNNGAGWHGVVEGIKTLLQKRNENNCKMKVGIYSVITRKNIGHIINTAKFVAELGVDYYIIQPMSVAKGHPLHGELSLDNRHYQLLEKAIRELMDSGLKLELPNNEYIEMFLKTVSYNPITRITNCFGGREFFFISPNGNLWDCPSRHKIDETDQRKYLSIDKHSACQLFSTKTASKDTACVLFSQDCVNMWQLMAYDDIVGK